MKNPEQAEFSPHRFSRTKKLLAVVAITGAAVAGGAAAVEYGPNLIAEYVFTEPILDINQDSLL